MFSPSAPSYQDPDLTPFLAVAESAAQDIADGLPIKVKDSRWYQRPFGPGVDCIEVVRFRRRELTRQSLNSLGSGGGNKLESLADFDESARDQGYCVSRKLLGHAFDIRVTLGYSGATENDCRLWLVLPSSDQEKLGLMARLVVNRLGDRVKNPTRKFRKYPFGGLDCIEVVKFWREELTTQTIDRLEWARRENLNEVKSLSDFADSKGKVAYFATQELMAKGFQPRDLRITLDRPVWDENFCKLWLVLPSLR